MLTASLISAVIGEYLPGHGTIYLNQTLDFFRPVFPEQEVKTTVTVERINYESKKVKLNCICTVNKKPVLGGTATVLAPSNKTQIK